MTAAVPTTPNNHFIASPNGSMKVASGWRTAVGDGDPCVGRRIVPSTGTQTASVVAAPDDHFVARPDRSVIKARARSIGARDFAPRVEERVVARTGIHSAAAVRRTAPKNHFRAGPHGCMPVARRRRVGRGG